LSGTNLELSVITTFEAQIENEGGVTVPVKAIVNFVQYNQDPEVLLETVEGTQLRLKSKHTKAVIAGEAASEYPTITPIEKKSSFSLPTEPLLDALNAVTFACAKTTSRPVLSGVYVRLEKNELILVATDSYRLSEFKIPVEGIHEEISCIIPAKVLEELRVIVGGQAFDEGDGDREAKKTKKKEAKTKEQKLDVSLSSQQIEVHVGPTRLLSRLIDGKFPNYQQILPKDKKTSFMVSTNELLTAVKRMHYFAKETNNNITFSVERGSMTLTTQETQLGKDESIIAVESEGENNKIALSSSYLIDYLSHVASDKLQVELTDHQHPALFRIPEDTRSLHLIMPLRMSGE
jgi:DNA polymerase-3 subunit beta